METAGQIPAGEPDPQRAVTEAERRRVVELSLRMLPEKERAAIVLRDLEGLSTPEVAQVLGSSEATVRSQISKARVKMRDFVERYFGRTT
jgi:RNA polymerase sigma-70 factor (ECF subfamily)